MPLGSRMGLGADTKPFLKQTPEGSVEAPREGARDGTLDTGAETDKLSVCGKADCVEVVGRDRWVSISRVALGCSNMAATGESLRRLQQSTLSCCMGSSRTSWIGLGFSKCGVLMVLVLVLTWLVCGTACCENMLSLPKVFDDLLQKDQYPLSKSDQSSTLVECVSSLDWRLIAVLHLHCLVHGLQPRVHVLLGIGAEVIGPHPRVLRL